MSRYLAFGFNVASASSWPGVLRRAYSGTFFRPVAFEAQSWKRRQHFFLAGSYVDWIDSANDLQVAATSDPRRREYLRQVEYKLVHRQKSPMPLPPGEMYDEQLLVSFMDEPPLEESALDECLQWVQRKGGGMSLRMSGTVDLSVESDDEERWKRCFDYGLVGRDGTVHRHFGPYLILNVSSPSDGKDQSEITVSSRSTIWLNDPAFVRGADFLGGRWTQERADVCLDRFVGLCRSLMQPFAPRINGAMLNVGNTFAIQDGVRIRTAFEKGLSGLEVAWDWMF